MVPAAAALLIGVGIYLRQHSWDHSVATVPPARVVNVASNSTIAGSSDPLIAGLNDDDLLQEVGEQAPAMKEQYAENLRRVNQYIQDEKTVVASDPNDEEARRSLMEAYQQKAMLFELALDRSLP
jgi:molybdopterin converting factor small subunit